MNSKLEQKITSCEWLLTDGATGTNLFDMGLMSGDVPELWNEKYPEKITKLHTDAVDAGSDIFLTNSFGSNALRLNFTTVEIELLICLKYLLKLLAMFQIVIKKKCLLQGQSGPLVKLCSLLESYLTN